MSSPSDEYSDLAARDSKIAKLHAEVEHQKEQNGILNAAAVLLQDERDKLRIEVERLMGLMREIRKSNDTVKGMLLVFKGDKDRLIKDKTQLFQQVRDQSTMIQNQRRTIAYYQAKEKEK